MSLQSPQTSILLDSTASDDMSNILVKKMYEQTRKIVSKRHNSGESTRTKRKIPLSINSENATFEVEEVLEMRKKEAEDDEIISKRLSDGMKSPLKENITNEEVLNINHSDESYTKISKKTRTESAAKRFRVIMECELNIGTLCIFDAEEYWTPEMISKYGCPHRLEASKRSKKSS